MLGVGDSVERYVVERLLGQGGMAAVFLIRHRELGSLHALKLLLVGSEGVQKRLLAEGRAQATLRHPNVVAVTDVLTIGGNPALVMEYVNGPALDELLRDRGRMPIDKAMDLFHGIVRGVSSAHKGGIIHRDLKPANVLLGEDEGRTVPKVADFGLTKAVTGEEGGTKSGVAMGTPEYMAPEQIKDASSVDRRADIFSLGVMLYELVCGVRPFEGENLLKLFNRIASGDYPRPDALIPGLPESVCLAIEGCLQVERDQRIQNCDELLSLLYSDQGSLESGRGYGPYKSAPGRRTSLTSLSPNTTLAPARADWRLPAAVGATMLVGIVGFVALAVATRQSVDSVPTEISPPEEVVAPVDPVEPVVPVEPVAEVVKPPVRDPGRPPVRPPDKVPKDDPVVVKVPKPVADGEGSGAGEGSAEGSAEPDGSPEVAPVAVVIDGPPKGLVSLSGDAKKVWAQAPDGTQYALPGPVPAGAYHVMAVFEDDAVQAADLVLREGESVALNCVGMFLQCRR